MTQGRLNSCWTNAFSSSTVSLVRVLPLSELSLLYREKRDSVCRARSHIQTPTPLPSQWTTLGKLFHRRYYSASAQQWLWVSLNPTLSSTQVHDAINNSHLLYAIPILHRCCAFSADFHCKLDFHKLVRLLSIFIPPTLPSKVQWLTDTHTKKENSHTHNATCTPNCKKQVLIYCIHSAVCLHSAVCFKVIFHAQDILPSILAIPMLLLFT